jgi:hypothetical protein
MAEWSSSNLDNKKIPPEGSRLRGIFFALDRHCQWILDCGGFKTAEKLELPNTLQLVTAKLPPFSFSWRLRPLS